MIHLHFFSLTDSKEVDLFIQNLQIEQWEYSSIPDGLGAQYEFLMYQEGAKQLLTDLTDMNYVGSLIIYPNEPFIEYKVNDFHFTFKIPEDVVTYLTEISSLREVTSD